MRAQSVYRLFGISEKSINLLKIRTSGDIATELLITLNIAIF